MVFSGDWHNKFGDVISEIDRLGIHDDDVVQVVDLGIGYNFDDLEVMHNFNNELSKRGLRLWAFRGNHDDPRYFMGKYMNYFSNLHLVPDYTVLNIQGKNILCIGGAISVDRMRMKKLMATEEEAGKLPIYFENENFVFDQEKLNTFRNIDILATHTSPSFCFPFGNGAIPEEDKTLASELIHERVGMGKVVGILLENNNITHHYYGHFHKSNVGMTEKITHTCLGINEFKELYI